MDKQTVIRAMKSYGGGAMFITRQKLTEFLGRKNPQSVDRYLSGLDRIDGMYFIPDVASRLLAERTVR